MAAIGETAQYTGEHSIRLKTKVGLTGWTDWFDICQRWHLVPTSRPVINQPEVKIKTFDNPGGDGIFDMTETLTGFPLYGQRTGSLEFYVLNGWGNWKRTYESIVNAIHGKNVQLMLTDDQAYYYNGRLTFNSWKSDKDHSIITLDYNLDPYKLCTFLSTEGGWMWDDVEFTSTYMIGSAKAKDLEFRNQRVLEYYSTEVGRPVTPIFRLKSGECTRVRLNNKELHGNAYVQHDNLAIGENHFMDMIMSGITPTNVNTITIYGTGVMDIEFRGGKL